MKIQNEEFDGMKAFNEGISFNSEKWATQEKVFQRFYYRTTAPYETHSIPKIMSEFVLLYLTKVQAKSY